MTTRKEPLIPADELLAFLEFVARADHEAQDAAVDLCILLREPLVLDAYGVYLAIFVDGPEADDVAVPGGTTTAGLGQRMIDRIQAIRAELPELVEGYLAEREECDR